MKMQENNFKFTETTDKIIEAFYAVYNTLGYGFLEKVYENALAIKLSNMNLAVEKQKRIEVKFEGKIIGEYLADLVVDNCVIVELKAAESICPEHEYQ